MNRGINGLNIFSGHKMKAQFLDYLEDSIRRFKLRMFAYCIMDNHYHLILENSTGKLSDFFRHLNGQYGMYYRKITGGKGYVFESRFKSTLIQDESYLMMSLGYALLNPVRAKIVQNFEEYLWSSGDGYFSDKAPGNLDVDFVNELFGSKRALFDFLLSLSGNDIPTRETRYGEVLGNPGYVDEALLRCDRRKQEYGDGMRRIDDRFFEPAEKILWEFERKIGFKIEDIDVDTWQGKRMRGELLVRLKDLGGFRYSEISKLPSFENYRLTSMAKLYKDTKRRLSKNLANKVTK
ncbi:MAG: transposase [Candidatus Aminicenantes bacterium]|nr:transposase [Candidatus Aminicenantes bacterium]